MIRQNPTRKPRSFLDFLVDEHLKNPNRMSLIDIRYQVTTFIIAGHDTTSIATSFAIYLLGLNQEIQSKVVQELAAVVGTSSDLQLTSDNVRKLVYLEQVLYESLRLYSPGAVFARQLMEDIDICGHRIKAGIDVLVCVDSVHRDIEQWPKPEVFNPDRFSPQDVAKRHPFSFIPFSAGPRNCIGRRQATLESLTMMAHILKDFKVTSLVPRDKLQLITGVTLDVKTPLKVRFELRDVSNPA